MNEHDAVTAILSEHTKAISKFPKFASPHEGYAILQEEVDELWDAIKGRKRQGNGDHLKDEAIQVAAMAYRFLRDCVP